MMEVSIQAAVKESGQLLQCSEQGSNYTCKVALQILIVLYNHGVVRKVMNLVELQQQLQDEKVTIGVLGRHSIGKSTLVNALLHGSYLPTKRTANTAVQVMIEHDEVESVLVMGSMKVAEGKQQIAKYIEGQNASTSKTEKQTEKLTLRLKIPLLSDAPSTFKAVLMDTPGFMEAMRERATQIAHESLKSSCAYLFVMTYEQMQDSGDAEILTQLQSFDKSFITDGRIVFAVTKFDNYYTGSDEEELSAVDTQEHVREGLLELGFNVSLESIVPISGKWALRARQLQADPQQNMHLLKDARRYLTDCKEKEARGEDESIDCHEQVRRMEPREVATELQKASQILDLEKRVKKIVSSCGDHLQKSVKSKVGGCLTKALDDLVKHSENMKKIFEECRTGMNRLCEIRDLKSKLSQAVDEATDLYGVKARIEHTACTDSKTAIKKVLRILEMQLQNLQHSYESTIRRQQYTPEMLDRDFPQLKKCQDHIDDAILNASYESTRRVYEQEVLAGRTSKDVRELEDLLKKHLTPAGCESQSLIDDARKVLKGVSREPLQLQDIYQRPQPEAWSTIDKLRLVIRNIFCYRKDGDPADLMDALVSDGPYPRKKDIQSIVDNFKTSFEKRCEELFFEENGIKDQVTKVVFASYCKDVSMKVEKAEESCSTTDDYMGKLRAGKKKVCPMQKRLDTLIAQLRKINGKL